MSTLLDSISINIVNADEDVINAIVRSALEDDYYDLQDAMADKEIVDGISRIALHIIQGRPRCNTQVGTCILTSRTGTRYLVKVSNTQSMGMLSFASVSSNNCTGVSDDCYAFWHTGTSDDLDYSVRNILGAVNEAYCRLQY